MPLDLHRWIELAQVARPHGVRGELRLKVFNADSDALLEASEILIRFRDGHEQEVPVESARRVVGAILYKLRGVNSRERADELREAHVCMRRDAFPRLSDDEFYVCDILGAEVWLAEADEEPKRIGKVHDLRSYPTVDALIVKADDEKTEWEVPLIEQFIAHVDAAVGRVTLNTLEGVTPP